MPMQSSNIGLIFFAGLASVFALGLAIYMISFLSSKKEDKYINQLKEHNLRKSRVESDLENSSHSRIQQDIRDFIYVDTERLNSFYSQAFEGVADRIVQSYVGGLVSTETQQFSKESGSLEAQVAEASLRTESKFLYDHMYNILESQVGSRILEPSGITLENYLEKIKDAYLLRVHGSPEIEDYQRMREFMDQFNSLADAIAYSTVHFGKTRENLDAAEQEIRNIQDPNKRAAAKKRYEAATDIKKLAKEMGLRQDEQLLKNLILFNELFYPGGFDITITPSDSKGIVYRAVLDRRWLRIQPNMLKALYGTLVQSEWTIVGQATFIPDIHNQTNDTAEESEDIITNDTPSMRDPFRNMFRSERTLENMFQQSKKRVEIIIAPLAIYREIKIYESKVN
jgi:hypothetical protein